MRTPTPSFQIRAAPERLHHSNLLLITYRHCNYETSDIALDSKEENIELKFEFSFCNAPTNDCQELDDEQCQTILQAVQEYVATVVAFTTSFLFLQFEHFPDLPKSARLLVKVAGYYMTYVHADKLYPWGSGFIAHRGHGDPVSIYGDIPQHRPYTIPSLESMTSLANHLPPTATNKSSFPRQLVEMTSMPEDEFNTVLQILPQKFDTMLIGYCKRSYLSHKASQCLEPTPRSSLRRDEFTQSGVQSNCAARNCSILSRNWCPGRVLGAISGSPYSLKIVSVASRLHIICMTSWSINQYPILRILGLAC
jgi:hypothetical protein